MPNAQGPGLCSTSVDKKDDHVCSMLVHVVCCNLIRVFFFMCVREIYVSLNMDFICFHPIYFPIWLPQRCSQWTKNGGATKNNKHTNVLIPS